jgi:hypothetical protein
MGSKDIIKHQFKRGQSGNNNGRPPKAISRITKDLIEMGYKIPSKTDILDAGLILMSLTTQEINDIANGKGDRDLFPYYYTRTAQELISDRGFEIIEKILDRALGKATQRSDVTTKDEKLPAQFIVSDQKTADEVSDFIKDLQQEKD